MKIQKGLMGLIAATSLSVQTVHAFQFVEEVPPAPPAFNGTPTTNTDISTPYQFDSQAYDPNGDSIVYRVSSWPDTDGLSIDANGLLTWTPTIDQVGQYWIFIYADDQQSGETKLEYQLTVNDPNNNAPSVNGTPVTETTINTAYQFDAQASDPDGDSITYSVSSWPETTGLSIDENGVFSWTPTADQVGQYWIHIYADDQKFGVTKFSYKLAVNDPKNNAPVFNGTPVTETTTNTAYQFDAQASDPDGDSITYSVSSWPDTTGLSIDENGVFSWTPTVDQIGQYSINIFADDQKVGVTKFSYQLAVSDPNNNAPVFTGTPVIETTTNTAYQFDAQASDPDGDSITYSVSSWPETTGLSIDENGVFSWTPTADQVGQYWIYIYADDQKLGVTKYKYELSVVEADPEPIVSDLPFESLVSNYSTVVYGTNRTVEFTARLRSSEGLTNNRVDLYRTDSNGNLLSFIGSLNDDASLGDKKSGDLKYTGQIEVIGIANGNQYFRGVASLDGESNPAQSKLIRIDVMPEAFSTPIDPADLYRPSDSYAAYPINRVVVSVQQETDLGIGEELAASYGGTVVGFGGRPLNFVLQVPTQTDEELQLIIDQLEADHRVIQASRNVLPEPKLVANDVLASRSYNFESHTWHFSQTYAFEAWDLVNNEDYVDPSTLSLVNVAIIDRGFEGILNHPEFENVNLQIIGPIDDLNGISDPYSGFYHGLAVAGLVGASSTAYGEFGWNEDFWFISETNGILGGVPAHNGSTPSSKIPYILTLGTNEDDFNKIISAIDRGARVINMSYGHTLADYSCTDPDMKAYVDQATFIKQRYLYTALAYHNPNVLFVIAAGNCSLDAYLTDTTGGVIADNVISVGATKRHKITYLDKPLYYPDFLVEHWSNYGPSVNLSAPGASLRVAGAAHTGLGPDADILPDPFLDNRPQTIAYSSNYTRFWKGTSFAAPQVAGAAALLMSLDNTLTPKEIKDLLINSANTVTAYRDMAGPLPGYGRELNIEDAVSCVIDKNNGEIIAGSDYQTGSMVSGIPAIDSVVHGVWGMDHGPDGTLYYVNSEPLIQGDRLRQIRRITKDGLVEVLYQGDYIRGIVVKKDGMVFFSEGSEVKTLDPEGNVNHYITADVVDGYQARPSKLAITDDGTLYYSQYKGGGQNPYEIVKVDVDGQKTTYHIRGNSVTDITVNKDKYVYFTDWINNQGVVRQITPLGVESTIYMDPRVDLNIIRGDGPTSNLYSLDVDHENNIYVANLKEEILKISPPNATAEVIYRLPETEFTLAAELRIIGMAISVNKDCSVSVYGSGSGLISQFD